MAKSWPPWGSTRLLGSGSPKRAWVPLLAPRGSWDPNKYWIVNIHQMEIRAASIYSGAHADDVDHVSWNPTHPELFISSSQKDRKIVFWDARRTWSSFELPRLSNITPTRKSIHPTTFSETHANTDWICAGRKDNILRIGWAFIVLPRART